MTMYPLEWSEAAVALEAGMTAAEQRYSRYEAATHGLGVTCGDPRPWPPSSEPEPGAEVSTT